MKRAKLTAELTDWFPASVFPVRRGVYHVDDPDLSGDHCAYWNGKRFCYRIVGIGQEAYKEAYEMRDCSTVRIAFVPWRGLTRSKGRK